MTIKSYLQTTKLTDSATITALVSMPSPCVRLDHTIFHAQGGGQKGDCGRIGAAKVLDTRHAGDGEVDHFVDSVNGLVVGERVDVVVDQANREQNARLHSAGHLIADAVHSIRPNLHAVAGHHWKGEARVEFEGAIDIDGTFEAELHAKLYELIAADIPLTIVGDAFCARALKIGDFEPVPCGGTHAASTKHLAGLEITGIRSKRGRLRVSYSLG